MRAKRRVLICGWSPYESRTWHWPSLAPIVLVSYLRKRQELAADYHFDLRDFNEEDTTETVFAAVCDSGAWLVGFSAYVWNIEQILQLSSRLKAQDPDLKIVLGGPQVSDRAFAEWIIDHNPSVDAVIRGEGELALAGLLARLLAPGRQWTGPGVTGRDSAGAPISGSAAPILRTLDPCLLPYLNGVSPLAHPRGLFLNLQSSRGCRYGCGYCAWGRTRFREFPLDLVLADLECVLAAPDVRGGLFLDADFFADDCKACAILEKLVAFSPEGFWQMEADPTRISERALALLARLPRTMVGLGLQSTNPMVLRLAGRPPVNTDLFARAAVRLRRGAPRLEISIEIMCGLPGDTAETYRNTLEYALQLAPSWLAANYLIPLPGTPFHRKAEHYGIRHTGPPAFQLLSTSTFPEEELRAAVKLTAFIRFCYERSGLRATVRNLGMRRGGDRPIVSIYEALLRAVEEHAGAIDSYPASPMADLDIFHEMKERYSQPDCLAALQQALLCEASYDVLRSGWRAEMH